MLFNFIKFDLYHGIIKKRRNIVSIFLIFTAINYLYMKLLYILVANGMILNISEINVGDYIMYYLAGISEYIIDESTPFPLPFLWMFQCLGCCYFCLRYPLEDLYTSGKHRLILCGNRSIWWISKCVWCFVNVMLYYALAYVSSTIVGLISGGKLSCSITVYTTYLLKLTGVLKDAPYNGALQFILIPFVIYSICLFQMMLSLVIKPLYSFVFIASYLLASAYFKTPFLIGNFAMLARSSLIDTKGFNERIVAVSIISVIVISIIGGNIIFNKKDIL